MPQLNGNDLSFRFYEALNPIADRMRNDYNTQGDKEVLADDLPRGNRLRPCDKETEDCQQEQGRGARHGTTEHEITSSEKGVSQEYVLESISRDTSPRVMGG